MDALEPIGRGIQIGVDLGQRVDPTAIVVCEVQLRDYTFSEDGTPRGGLQHYLARHVERMPLNTSYPRVAERLAEIVHTLKAGREKPTVYVDATGVGTPVCDLLRRAGVSHTAVYLTGGEKESQEHGELHLPKTLLVSRLQVLLQSHRIHLPQTAEAQALADELLTFEIRVTEAAHLQMGVFSTGKHDDLAVALGLACRQHRRSQIAIW